MMVEGQTKHLNKNETDTDGKRAMVARGWKEQSNEKDKAENHTI